MKGRAGAALGITAIGSFLGGTFAILGLALLASTLTQIARMFASPELFLLMLPMIRVFVSILRVPQAILAPVVILIAICGVYAINNSMFDVLLMLIFGVAGFLLRRFDFDLAPLILGFILGPMLEVEWRRSMIMSGGSVDIFFTRTPSLTILLLLVSTILLVAIGALMRRRRAANDSPGGGIHPYKQGGISMKLSTHSWGWE